MATKLSYILYCGLSMAQKRYAAEWLDRMVLLGTCVLHVQHEMPIIVTTNTDMSRKGALTLLAYPILPDRLFPSFESQWQYSNCHMMKCCWAPMPKGTQPPSRFA